MSILICIHIYLSNLCSMRAAKAKHTMYKCEATCARGATLQSRFSFPAKYSPRQRLQARQDTQLQIMTSATQKNSDEEDNLSEESHCSESAFISVKYSSRQWLKARLIQIMTSAARKTVGGLRKGKKRSRLRINLFWENWKYYHRKLFAAHISVYRTPKLTTPIWTSVFLMEAAVSGLFFSLST